MFSLLITLKETFRKVDFMNLCMKNNIAISVTVLQDYLFIIFSCRNPCVGSNLKIIPVIIEVFVIMFVDENSGWCIVYCHSILKNPLW